MVCCGWDGVMVEGDAEADEAGEVKPSGSEELLLMAAENLKRSIEFAVRKLDARKVHGEVKLRWSRSLTRQVEALVKVAEALNKIGGKSVVDVDMATYLSGLESKVPTRFVTKKFVRIVRKMRASKRLDRLT